MDEGVDGLRDGWMDGYNDLKHRLKLTHTNLHSLLKYLFIVIIIKYYYIILLILKYSQLLLSLFL